MTPLTDNDREELIAYLDGEMDENTAHAFETRLRRDAALRAEAEVMKKTWELLDYLPRPEPSPQFTHRTLERLTVQDLQNQSAKAWRWKWLAPIGWAAGLLLAIGAGLFGANLFWPAPNSLPPAAPVQTGLSKAETEAAIVQDLDVIRNRRLYEFADDIEFVRQLPNAMGGDEEGGS
jgi:anti-sigma factor RsiW